MFLQKIMLKCLCLKSKESEYKKIQEWNTSLDLIVSSCGAAMSMRFASPPFVNHYFASFII